MKYHHLIRLLPSQSFSNFSRKYRQSFTQKQKKGTKVTKPQQNSTSGAIFHRCIGMMMTCRAKVLTSPPFCCYCVYCLLFLTTYIQSFQACFRTYFSFISFNGLNQRWLPIQSKKMLSCSL